VIIKSSKKTPQYNRLNKPIEQDENGNFIFIIEQLKDKNIIISDLQNPKHNKNYTSELILYLLRKFPKIKFLFDGIMYTGRNDGNCCVVFFNSVYNTSIPLGYYTPKNDSPRSINDYKYISSFNKDNSNFKNVVNDKLNKNLSKNKYLNSIISGEITFKDVPENHRTKEICELIISQDGLALQYVPEHLIDYSLCEIAVSQNSNALQYVPNTLKNYYSLCEKVVSYDGNALQYVSEKFKDYPLCEKAVLTIHHVNGEGNHALKYVPENLKDYKLCYKAVSYDGETLEYVPENLKDYKLCKKAVDNSYGLALRYVPENIEKLYSLVKLAYIKNDWIYKGEYFPEHCYKYIPRLKKDFPNDIYLQNFNDYIIKEYISKEVRKLLKEYYLNKNKR
jgi:hypothetical protein